MAAGLKLASEAARNDENAAHGRLRQIEMENAVRAHSLELREREWDAAAPARESALAEMRNHLLLTLKTLNQEEAAIEARDARIADLEVQIDQYRQQIASLIVAAIAKSHRRPVRRTRSVPPASRPSRAPPTKRPPQTRRARAETPKARRHPARNESPGRAEHPRGAADESTRPRWHHSRDRYDQLDDAALRSAAPATTACTWNSACGTPGSSPASTGAGTAPSAASAPCRLPISKPPCSTWPQSRNGAAYAAMNDELDFGILRRITMEPLHEALRLIRRQAELEAAMRRPGGIRVTEERELFHLRAALTQLPAAVKVIVEAASLMRRPVETISAEDVDRVSTSH